MPYTTAKGITVPGSGDIVNSLAQFKTLADTIDQSLVNLENKFADTGWINLTPVNGWSIAAAATFQVRKWGPLCFMRGRLNVPANIFTSIVTLPPQFRPLAENFYPGSHISSGGSASSIQFVVSTMGSIDVWTATPGADRGVVPMNFTWIV